MQTTAFWGPNSLLTAIGRGQQSTTLEIITFAN
jgi:hypothetical protein